MQCHICGSDNVGQYIRAEGFDICRCGDCLTQSVNPMPESSVSCGESSLRNPFYGWLTFWRQRMLVEKLANRQGGKILDYGCGGGYFLNKFWDSWDRYGVEISKSARIVAANKGIRRVYDSFECMQTWGEFFDVITMFAVLEHLPNPKGTVAGLSKLLKVGGLFVVMTGDVESPRAKYKKEKWHMYCPPLHLYFFSAKAIDMIMRGLRFRKVRSLYTDGGMMKIPFVDLAYPVLRKLPLFDHYYSYWVKEG